MAGDERDKGEDLQAGARLLLAGPRIKVPREELQFTFVRSSGPGGQNVNKVNSKAVLRWSVASTACLPPDVRQRFLTRYGNKLTVEGELLVASQRYRDQGRNIEDCLDKLRDMLLAIAAAPVKRRKTRPTRASKERRLKGKQEQGQKKERRRSVSGGSE